MKLKLLFGLLLGVVLLVSIVGGCKKSSGVQAVPSGVFVGAEGCKFQGGGPMARVMGEDKRDCLEYQYDGQGILKMTHVNGGFNCCPGQVTGEITISGRVITVIEMEEQAECRCLCLYDLDYEIIDLSPGRYTVRIEGLYLEEGDGALEFLINLPSSTSSGALCLERNYYPWN